MEEMTINQLTTIEAALRCYMREFKEKFSNGIIDNSPYLNEINTVNNILNTVEKKFLEMENYEETIK